VIPQRAPNSWSCTPTAFAMVLSIDVARLVEMVGHDGSEIYWPDLPSPLSRRGFHIQEMIEVADQLGWSVTPFDARLFSGGPGKNPIEILLREPPALRMQRVMNRRAGVINGSTLRGMGHSVAWDGHNAIDTNATQFDLSRLNIHSFYELTRRRG
jgi:hypothetical protein